MKEGEKRGLRKSWWIVCGENRRKKKEREKKCGKNQ